MDEKQRKRTVADIVAKIGRSTIETELGVGDSSVRSSVSKGEFPAKWLPGIRQLAVNAGCAWRSNYEFDLFATLKPLCLQREDQS